MTRRQGATLLELLVVVGILGLLLALLIPGVRAARQSSIRAACSMRLRQIGVALASYESAFRVYPFGSGADGDASLFASVNHRRYSAHSQLLSFLGESSLYESINFGLSPFDAAAPAPYSWNATQWPNETAASVVVRAFLCPADIDRLARLPWGKNSYRACSGSTPDARTGNGMFGQSTATTPAGVSRGLSKTASFSERIRGDDDLFAVDMQADLFVYPASVPFDGLVVRCASLSEDAASRLPQEIDGGHTWLEGNINWTRYNHALPPGRASCKRAVTWLGTVMPATSRHASGVNVLFGDGRVDFTSLSVDAAVWEEMGSRQL